MFSLINKLTLDLVNYLHLLKLSIPLPLSTIDVVILNKYSSIESTKYIFGVKRIENISDDKHEKCGQHYIIQVSSILKILKVAKLQNI